MRGAKNMNASHTAHTASHTHTHTGTQNRSFFLPTVRQNTHLCAIGRQTQNFVLN